MIDLHVHSTKSDGTKTPFEILQLASDIGLRQLSITDHNTLAGSLEAIKYLANFPELNFVMGCELSGFYYNKEVHILGYFDKNNYNSESLRKFIEDTEVSKEKALREMIKKLNEKGIELSYEEMLKAFPDTVLNRTHIATLLMRHSVVSSVKEGFDTYIGYGKDCFVEREFKPLKEVIDIIHDCNGIAILAHTYLNKPKEADTEKYLSGAFSLGLDGAEAIHSNHTKEQAQSIIQLCKKYNKRITGGSDYHGDTKPTISLGGANVPDDFIVNYPHL